MNKQFKDIFSETDCLSLETIRQYLDDQLGDRERQQVEKHLTDCPLCSDAVEGFGASTDFTAVEARIAALKKNISFAANKQSSGLMQRDFVKYAAAAAIVLIISGVTYIYVKNISKDTNLLITEEISSPRQEESPVESKPVSDDRAKKQDLSKPEKEPTTQEAGPQDDKITRQITTGGLTTVSSQEQAMGQITSTVTKKVEETTVSGDKMIDETDELKSADAEEEIAADGATANYRFAISGKDKEEPPEEKLLEQPKSEVTTPSTSVEYSRDLAKSQSETTRSGRDLGGEVKSKNRKSAGKKSSAMETPAITPKTEEEAAREKAETEAVAKKKAKEAAMNKAEKEAAQKEDGYLELNEETVIEISGEATSAPEADERKTAATAESEKAARIQTLEDSDVFFSMIEKMPQFPGGEEKLQEYLKSSLIYPDSAKEKGLEGIVYVTFIVKADSSLDSIKVLKGIGTECDKEALRVVKAMPKWMPGEQMGKPVPVQFNLPVRFKLN
ncbi:MAG: TonB family protein [Bacteroidota bacterium]